jgi:hypothetical protein
MADVAAPEVPCPLLGHSLPSHSAQRRPLSVFAPIGDKTRCGRFVREVPIATNAPQQTASLFDHLVGADEQRRRHGETECLGGLEVDHQFEFGRLLNRQVSRFIALKNPCDVNPSLSISIRNARSVTDQTAGNGVLAEWVDRWDPRVCRQRRKLLAPSIKKWIRANKQSVGV